MKRERVIMHMMLVACTRVCIGYILRCRFLHDLHDRGRQAEAHVNHVATDTEVM